MTPDTCVRRGPSRLHVLMRSGRSALIARYLELLPDLPKIACQAVADHWSRERLATAIVDLEREEVPGDVAHVL